MKLRGLALLLAALTGCGDAGPIPADAEHEVVVYTALDREFAEPIFARFTSETGINVRPLFDTEATKTVGLAQRILAERNRPRCDVFWNNEIVNTYRLKREGVLAEYRSPAAADFPAAFKADDGTWHGFAARARVLLVHADQVPDGKEPTSILDLIKPEWKGKVGIAKPLFGTTATHAACLFSVWGSERAKAFFRDLKANDVQVLAGNKQVALGVVAGDIAVGLTDTDDAIVEIQKGRRVRTVYLDAGPKQLGTLFIPNTLALVRDAPHPNAAHKLIDYLLSPATEKALAEGPGAQIPLGPNVAATVRVKTPRQIQPMAVDFDHAAGLWDDVQTFLAAEFAAP